MVDKLESRLMDFPGASNRARCFAHILNLVVKSMMHQFDARSYITDERFEELAGDLDSEELEELEGEQEDYCDDDADDADIDNADGWIDERDEMDAKEIEELEDKIQPVRFVLTKVSELVVLYSIS